MTPDERPEGLIRSILALLAEMDEAGERTNHGRWIGHRSVVDYEVSLGGLGDSLGWDDRTGSDTPPIATRRVADGMLVAVDLPDVQPEDVSVELDRHEGTLVLTVENEVIGHAPLEAGGWSIEAISINNDVMTIRLTNE